ncbi:MAG TPA: NAD-dependent epimerase/dehydratase family protein [Mycobacteriales bacterium]|nr:NAD-dependent epimerase/dehydratase family protein [Mycobacteriales bacterium]
MTRVVIVGASGNVGSRVVENLRNAGVDELVGVARRPPRNETALSWVACDIGLPDAAQRLSATFRGADAVVHLAWQIQPGRDTHLQWRTNVQGSRQVMAAVRGAGVPALVYASSVGAYSAGPKNEPVDESWPTRGTPSSTYACHKAAVERLLDQLEAEVPALRVVRFRPGLIFQRAAASEIARYFLGPYVPLSAVRRRLIPVVPAFPRLAFQAVHSDDVGAAFAKAVLDPTAVGAYNLAAEPVLDAAGLAAALHARPVPVPYAALRAAADAAFRLRLTPTDAGWLDMAAAVPVMSSQRARAELGWVPRHSSKAAFVELLDGMHDAAGGATPPLRKMPAAAGRLAELARTAAHGGPGSENP